MFKNTFKSTFYSFKIVQNTKKSMSRQKLPPVVIKVIPPFDDYDDCEVVYQSIAFDTLKSTIDQKPA